MLSKLGIWRPRTAGPGSVSRPGVIWFLYMTHCSALCISLIKIASEIQILNSFFKNHQLFPHHLAVIGVTWVWCLAEYNGFGWVAKWTLLARLFSPLHMYHEGLGHCGDGNGGGGDLKVAAVGGQVVGQWPIFWLKLIGCDDWIIYWLKLMVGIGDGRAGW